MIEQCKPQEIDAVMQIWLQANIEAHGFLDRTYWESNYELVQSLLPQAEVAVYKLEGEVVGFAGIMDRGYIAGIFVKPGCQSRGIGGALIRHCQAKYSELRLDVYASNQRAVSFYERQGFARVGKKVNEDTGEWEYAMVWSSGQAAPL